MAEEILNVIRPEDIQRIISRATKLVRVAVVCPVTLELVMPIINVIRDIEMMLGVVIESVLDLAHVP